MTAPTRADLVRSTRAALSECADGERVCDASAALVLATHGHDHPLYPLALVKAQFWRAQAAAWRDFGRRLRDLLAELGEAP